MWIAAAVGSALFAGITAILCKCGLQNTDSDAATALRTSVVLAAAWVVTFVTGAYRTIGQIDGKSWIFLVLSGIATGGSWICYFQALQRGEVSKVAAADKSSTVLTVLIAIAVFPEERTNVWLKLCFLAVIAAGTLCMTKTEKTRRGSHPLWLLFALLSAAFAAASALLARAGIHNVDSNLATAIRTSVVTVIAWTLVFTRKKTPFLRKINAKEGLFLVLSGIATGASWLCFYYALAAGKVSVVVTVDKLSILITVLFSVLFLKETLSLRGWIGLLLLTLGSVCLAVFT